MTYTRGHAFSVEVRDVDKGGAVIGKSVNVGADSGNRIQIMLSEDSRAVLQEEAIEDAMVGARSEAELLAGAADSAVVDVRSVESTDVSVRPVSRDVLYAESADGDGGGTDLVEDDVTVTAQVTVTYAIE